MTKKLLLPTRVRRMQIRQQHNLHPEKSTASSEAPKTDGVKSSSSLAQPTNYHQGYEKQPAVNWYGNPIQQQPQDTGYSNNQYPYVPAQETGFSNGHAPGLPDQQTVFQQNCSLTSLKEPTLQSEGTLIHDHNRHCEENENDARFQKRIEDQKALKQKWLAQHRVQSAVLGHVPTDEQSPTPLALPPRSHKYQRFAQSHGLTSQKDALLRQIREIASGGSGQEVSVVEEPSKSSMSTSGMGTVRKSPAPPSSVGRGAASESEFLARSLGRDAGLDPQDRSLPLPDSNPAEGHQGNFGVPTKCNQPSCDVCTTYWGQRELDDQSIRKPPPPPIPPKPQAFQPGSANEAWGSLPPTRPYHTLTGAVRHASTAASIRVYTSNCGNFKVEAELLDWKDGKVWLRKANSVKIAVPLSRFSGQDVEYVVTEMMRRVDQGRTAIDHAGSDVVQKDDTATSCGVQAGLHAELEGAYAITT